MKEALTPDVCSTLYPQLASVGKQPSTDSPETSSVIGTRQGHAKKVTLEMACQQQEFGRCATEVKTRARYTTHSFIHNNLFIIWWFFRYQPKAWNMVKERRSIFSTMKMLSFVKYVQLSNNSNLLCCCLCKCKAGCLHSKHFFPQQSKFSLCQLPVLEAMCPWGQ